MEQALRLFPLEKSGWRPQILMGSAQEKTGLQEVWELIQSYLKQVHSQNLWESHRREQTRQWFREQLQVQLAEQFFSHPRVQAMLPRLEAAVQAQEQSPSQAAEALIALWRESNNLA